MRADVAIVGGGITGLSAAYRLQKLFAERGQSINAVLIEKDQRPGGKLVTRREDGFIVECGPDSFLASKPWAMELIRDLGLESDVVHPQAHGSHILKRRTIHRIPDGLTGIVPSRPAELWAAPFMSFRGKLRASMEPLVPRRKSAGDESVGAFLRRRAGMELSQTLLEPFTSGIYGGDAMELSLRALFPSLAEWESKYGSLARGARAARKSRPKSSHSKGAVYSMRFGAASIVDAIVSRLESVTVITGFGVTEIDRRTESESALYTLRLDDGRIVTADNIILATPAGATARLARGFAPDCASLVSEIQYRPAASVSLVFNRDQVRRPIEGSGFLVPRTEPSHLLGCTWVSSKWPTRSHGDAVFLRVYAGASALQMDDKALAREVTAELGALMDIDGAPRRSWVTRWPEAMPHYRVGHLSLMGRLDAALARHPGLFLAGAAYRGIGVPDCIRQGFEAADGVVERISARHAGRAVESATELQGGRR
ncbi:MAG: protoporphyrinogen oxidase [SAR202 cluster bacterium]|nr:protoporphyrinogen oxidase [SAR202 cluster bacterium]